MKSSKAKDKGKGAVEARVETLMLELMSLTGYKIACVYATESNDSICGYIIGNEKCFESLSDDK